MKFIMFALLGICVILPISSFAAPDLEHLWKELEQQDATITAARIDVITQQESVMMEAGSSATNAVPAKYIFTNSITFSNHLERVELSAADGNTYIAFNDGRVIHEYYPSKKVVTIKGASSEGLDLELWRNGAGKITRTISRADLKKVEDLKDQYLLSASKRGLNYQIYLTASPKAQMQKIMVQKASGSLDHEILFGDWKEVNGRMIAHLLEITKSDWKGKKKRMVHRVRTVDLAPELTALELQFRPPSDDTIQVYDARYNPVLVYECNGRMPAASELADLDQKTRTSLSGLRRGLEFPDLVIPTIGSGNIRISSLKGKVVLIDFWATWCGPCVQEVPTVVSTYKKYHDQGFEVIGISLDSDRAQLLQFSRQAQMSWPMYFDGKGWSNPFVRQFGIKGIPTMILLDKQGRVVSTTVRGSTLETLVQNLL